MGNEREVKAVDPSVIKSLSKRSASTAKNLLKKLKRKEKKSQVGTQKMQRTRGEMLRESLKDHFSDFENRLKEKEGVEIEYVVGGTEEALGEFEEVFERFSELENRNFEEEQPQQPEEEEGAIEDQFDDSDSDEDESNKQMSSKKRFKLMNRPTLAQLKQIADRPEVVEIWDTTASDPRFLVWLKAQRNSAIVPSHWSEKTRYMQGKKSFDKPAFKLPHYIEATKISEIRAALQEKEAAKSLKQKQREKVRPKSHRMDIDYQTLHDAFFKYATKPSMTRYGDIYYEGKEMELRMRRYRPGQLSQRLKQALGVGENAPPPWLINMQRFGPPPSYPNLRIPGVNAPLPEGATFGFHAGGWGQLPIDDSGNPIFGFIDSTYYEDNHIDKSYWGEIPPSDEPDADDDEEEEEEEEEKKGKEEGTSVIAPTPTPIGITTPLIDVGLGGMDTPIDLTKPRLQLPKKPYTVLEAKQSSRPSTSLFGSQLTYQIPPVATPLTPGGGLSTPLGGMVTPSLNIEDGVSTTEAVVQQLKYHEQKSKMAREAAGQIEIGKSTTKRPKKKEFKF